MEAAVVVRMEEAMPRFRRSPCVYLNVCLHYSIFAALIQTLSERQLAMKVLMGAQAAP